MEISTGRNFSVLKDRQQVPKDWRSSYARPDPIRLSRAATDALTRASTEELLLELRRRIITPRPATDATRPGTTGAA
jgi:hypothetical protein